MHLHSMQHLKCLTIFFPLRTIVILRQQKFSLDVCKFVCLLVSYMHMGSLKEAHITSLNEQQYLRIEAYLRC